MVQAMSSGDCTGNFQRRLARRLSSKNTTEDWHALTTHGGTYLNEHALTHYECARACNPTQKMFNLRLENRRFEALPEKD